MKRPQPPLSDPEVQLLEQAQSLLDQGNFLQSRPLFLSLLQQTSPSEAELCQIRLQAMSGVIELAARQQQQVALDEAILFLKSELEHWQRQSSGLDDAQSSAMQLNRLCERLAAFRSWKAVKQISRLVLRHVIDESEGSQSHRIRALNNLGSALLAEGRYDDAIHVWECTIGDYEAKAAHMCPSPLATIHNNLAELRRLQCRIPQACEHHRRALALRLNCPEPDPILIRQSQFNLVQVLMEAWGFAEGLDLIQQYLNSPAAVDPRHAAERLRGQVLEARLLIEQGRWLTAETLVNQLVRAIARGETVSGRLRLECHLLRLELAIQLNKPNIIRGETERIAALLEEHRLTETILEARYQLLLGRMSSALSTEPIDNREAHIQHALRILRKRLPRNHPWIAIAVFDLAAIFTESQRGQRAVQTANSAMAVLEQTFGERGLPMLFAVTELGKVVLARGQYKSVRQLMRLALQLRREHGQIPAPIEFEIYNLLAKAYAGLDKIRPAAWFARRGWQFLRSQLEYPIAAQLETLDQTLRLSQQAGHAEAAIELAVQRIDLLRVEYHAEHPEVYRATEELGRLYAAAGDGESAAAYLSQVLTVRCSELGEDSPAATELMELTARMHRLAGQTEKAELIEEQLQLQAQKASHVLSDLF